MLLHLVVRHPAGLQGAQVLFGDLQENAPGDAPSIVLVAFDAFELVADIGGGRGHLLQAVLARAPRARGVVFDLPHVIADAAAAAAPRLKLVAGDFFVDALPAADKQQLLLFLAARLREQAGDLPAPRRFSGEQLRAWIAEDEADMQRFHDSNSE